MVKVNFYRLLMLCSLTVAAIAACDNSATGQNPDDVTAAKGSPLSVDANAPVKPSNPTAPQQTVTFAQGSSLLTGEAKDKLRELANDLDDAKQSYLTIRIEDSDSVEATEPQDQVAKLANPRSAKVAEFLKREGVNIAGMAIDHAGTIADQGEANPMARPEPRENQDDVQYLTVTIESAEQNGPS